MVTRIVYAPRPKRREVPRQDQAAPKVIISRIVERKRRADPEIDPEAEARVTAWFKGQIRP